MRKKKPPFNLSRNQMLMSSALLVILIFIGSGLFLFLKKNDLQTQILKFESQSVQLVTEIEKEIELDLEILSSLKALYSINDSISREQFKTFTRNALSRTNSIQAIEWIPKVTLDNKDQYINEAHKDGLSTFKITERINGNLTPVTDRNEYFPVYYLEPLKGNEAALGFDLGSNRTRLEALTKASEIDKLVATGRITLVQEKTSQFGILVFLASKRDQELLGYHLGVFRVKDLVTNAIGNLNKGYTNLVIYDLSANEDDQLLLQLSEDSTPINSSNSIAGDVNGLNFSQTIKIADRTWSLHFSPTQLFLNSTPSDAFLYLFIYGVFSFGILYFFLFNFKEINRRIEGEILLEKMVEIKTVEIENRNKELNSALKNISDYKFALDQTDIVVITDLKGTIEYVNDLFCSISKYSREELIGQNQRIVNSEYHSHEFWKEMWATIGKGKVWQNEIRNKAKDGSIYWVETTIIPFLNNSGKPHHYIALRHDITDRKLREIELSHYQKKLEQTNKNLEKFTAITAHDMKTPLNSVIGLVILLESELSENNNPKVAKYISLLKKINNDTKELISGVLKYSKIGFSRLELEQIDLGKLIEVVAFKYRSNTKNVINVGPNMPVVKHYKIALMQVIDNILSNSIKYNDKNFCVINIMCKSKDDFYEVSISDNGPGIPEDDREIVFDLFENLKNKNENSTGIGLATVKKIVNETNGEIWIESSANNGAKFIFTIEKNN